MVLVDVHCHLQYVDNIEEVLKRAKEANVVKIINNGTNPKDNRITLELAKKYKCIGASLGLYPDFAEHSEEIIDQELDFILKNRNKIISIGEVGLDNKIPENKTKQKNMFLKIIELSEKINKPLIIHSRGAEKECVELLESSKCKKVVMHMFSGNKKLIKKGEQLGFHFTVPCIINKSEHFQMLSKIVNINQLLTETDCPWLSPFPDKKNEPSFIPFTIKKIAEIKQFDPIEVENNLFMNYQRLFLK